MIDADRITKRFEQKTVLDRLSLSVEKGELFTLLGPNGSGKTTLLKCLAGLYVPLSGTITIDGLDRCRDHLEIRRFTAWLADQPFVYPRLSGRDWLRMIADVYEVDRARRDARIEALLDAFDLTEVSAEPVGYYSNGQHKKIAVCGVLVSNARLLLLDEPFAGEIDPPGAAALREILRDLSANRGVTTVLTTQIVDQAERLADRVGILVDGRLADVGRPDELRERHAADSLEEVLTVLHSRGAGPGARGFLDTLGQPIPSPRGE